MIKKSSYWANRQKQYFANLEKNEERLYKKLDKAYAKEVKKLSKEIASCYAIYGEDNVIEYKALLTKLTTEERRILMQDMDRFFDAHPTLEHLRVARENAYKIDRLESLNYSILKQQAEIGLIEEKMLEEHLLHSGVEVYNKVVRDMGLGTAFLSIDDVKMRQLINDRWVDNRNFSDSVWSNREKVAKFLQNDFKDGIIRGDNYNKLGKILSERFINQSRSNIKRLIYTEGTFVQNQSMVIPFEQAGYKRYVYDAVLDDVTTDTCEGLDGEEFLFADRESGVNFPPMHSYCRSSFTVVLESRRDIEE